MSSQIFLKIEIKGGVITGEGSTAGYLRDIECESFDFNLGSESPEAKKKAKEAHRQAVADAKAAGKAPPTAAAESAENTLTITKFYDRASTNLARYLAKGTDFTLARLAVNHHVLTAQGRGKANPALTIKLYDGRIKSVSLNLSDSDKSAKLTETVKLTYKKIEVTYHKSGGTDRTARGTGTVFSYDVRDRSFK